MARHLDQQAFVIHSRDYGETSQILELLSRDYGRISLVNRGARRRRGLRMQPFTRYALGWSGRAQLKNLTTAESECSYLLQGDQLIAGFYMNELIWYLTRLEDECREIYIAYEHCLQAMQAQSFDLDIILRRFEQELLEQLGYGLRWEVQSNGGQQIDPDRDYYFRFGEGFFQREQPGDIAVSGAVLLALQAEDYTRMQTRRSARQLFRVALNHLLQGRELRSRSMLVRGGR